jgi:hypothetical protein
MLNGLCGRSSAYYSSWSKAFQSNRQEYSQTFFSPLILLLLFLVCRSCWGGVRKRLQLELKNFQKSNQAAPASRVEQELQLGERFLVELGPSDVRSPLEGKKSENELLKESCPHCRQSFGVWLPPTLCGRCEQVACTGPCCTQFAVSTEQTCCKKCWPGLRPELQQRILHAPSESVATTLRSELDAFVFWFDTVTPSQYYESLKQGKAIERFQSSSAIALSRKAATAACIRCHAEFDKGRHLWHMCSECQGEVCKGKKERGKVVIFVFLTVYLESFLVPHHTMTFHFSC